MRESRGGFRGGNRGGFRGNSRGRGRGGHDFLPPQNVIPLGEYTHTCEDFMICKAITQDVPLINRPVYKEDKTKIGVVDEVFGPINSYGFSVKLDEGVKATSFKVGLNVFTDPYHLKTVDFFQHKPKPKNATGTGPGIAKGPNSIAKGGRGGFRGAPRGGFRGAPRGGFRGAPRGGFRGE